MERMGRHARAVRSVPAWSGRRASKQILLLVLLIVIAFGSAIHLGIRQPDQPSPPKNAEPLHSTVIPLAPQGLVPGGAPEELYAHSLAAQFRIGASGITLPGARSTGHFSEVQVMTALTIAKEYLVQSSLDPDVLMGGGVRSVRVLLDPDQLEQFDRSIASPTDDGRHAATGWLLRYDPAKVALADPEVRVHGMLRVAEAGADALEVTSDHTLAYALRPAAASGPQTDAASLFTVRRELRFRFDRDDLYHHRAELLASRVQAGPQACSADAFNALRPLFAGQRASAEGPAVTDPYATGQATAAFCGVLSPGAQPSL
jgi:hypothetical protein